MERNPRRRRKPRAATLPLSALIDVSLQQQQTKDAEPSDADKDSDKKRKGKPKRRRRRLPFLGSRQDATSQACGVVIENMVDVEELEDPDERADVEADLRTTLGRSGELDDLQISECTGAITAVFASRSSAEAAVRGLNGKEFGSRTVVAKLQSMEPQADEMTDVLVATPREKTKRRSQLKCAMAREAEKNSGVTSHRRLTIHNLLDPAELEDDDEFADVLDELGAELRAHGEVVRINVIRHDDANADGCGVGDVIAEFEGASGAMVAFEFYNGKTFGGRVVVCTWLPCTDQGGRTVSVVGMFGAEELDDPDEFEDLESESKEFFSTYHKSIRLTIERESGKCIVECPDSAAAIEFTSVINGKRYGGRELRAHIEAPTQHIEIDSEVSLLHKSSEIARHDRVTSSPEISELVAALLRRLASLQERAHEQNPLQDKRSRRLVLGMHQVRRGVLQNKIRLLIIATDVESARPLADQIDEFAAEAEKQSIPVVFPMNRRKLGRVLKKDVRVSCVGVYSVDGANDLFRELMTLL